MEFRARQKWILLSPQKARLVADAVRGMDVQEALDVLKFTPRKAAGLISKAVHSALANAKSYAGDEKPDLDRLYVKTLAVDGGPVLKRLKHRAYGRAHRIRRRTSHITVVLTERPEDYVARGRPAAEEAAGEGAEGQRRAPRPAKAGSKPKKRKLFGFRKTEKYGGKVKSGGEPQERHPPEHRKTERGTKGGKNK
jgi:large subunit ribosomal protein L22